MHHKTSKNASFIWKGLASNIDLVRQGSCYKIDSRNTIKIWDDPWIPGKTDFKPEPKTGADPNTINSPQWVYELIDSDTMTWKTKMLEEFFEDSTIRIIQTIQLPISLGPYLLKWTKRANGELIAKEAYLLDQQHRPPRNTHFLASQWKALWRARIHERFKLLLWKMVWNVLPTNEVIGRLQTHLSAWASRRAEEATSIHESDTQKLIFLFHAAVLSLGTGNRVAQIDNRGSLIRAWSSRTSTTDPKEGEDEATLQAIIHAIKVDTKHLVLLGDA